MITGFRNALLNPGFDFWDFGAGPFTTSGYTATRWKMAVSGSPSVSVEQGTNDTSTATAKWLRGRPNMQITVSAYDSGTDSITITQRMEAGERFGQQNAILSGIAYGPAGEHFYVTINSQSHKIETLGDSGGVDIPTHFSIAQVITDPSTEYISLVIFTRPSATGTYKIGRAQLEFTEFASAPEPFEIRGEAVERALLNRFVCTVGFGINMPASGTTALAGGLRFPCKMRIVPTFVQVAASPIAIVSASNGTAFTAASPVFTTPTAVTEYGCRFKIDGFTGLTADRVYVLGDDVLGIFNADY